MRTILASVGCVVLLLLSCSNQEGEQQRTGALAEVAKAAAEGSVSQRLERMEGQLSSIQGELSDLRQKIQTGTVVVSGAAQGPKDGNSLTPPPKPEDAGADAEPVNQAAKAPEGADKPAKTAFELTWPAPSDKVTVVLWHSYRGKEKEALEKCAQVFNTKYPTIQIDVQEVPFNALRDKVTNTVSKGGGPDLFVFAHNQIGDWVFKGNILTPLTTYLDQYDDIDNLKIMYIPELVRALGYDGTLYGLPLSFKSHALVYNKKLVSTPPKTTDELITMALAAQAKGGSTDDDRVYGLVYDAGLYYNHALWVHAFGDPVLDDAGVPHINTPGMVQSVEFVRGLAQKGVLPQLDDSMGTFLFNSGRVAFMIRGSWALGEIDPSIEYGVALLPQIDATHSPRPYLGSEGVFLAASSKQKEAAFQVMRWFASDEAAEIRFLEGRQLVANRFVYADEALRAKADPALDVFWQQSQTAVLMSSRPEMQAVWATMDNALKKAIFGDVAPATSLGEAQAKSEADIGKMGKR